jgi:hypothetical protein
MADTRLTVMLVPHNHKRGREITISRRAITIGAISLVALVFIGLSYAVGFHFRSIWRDELAQLRQENSRLSGRIQDMAGSVVTLKTQMSEIERREEMLRVLANLPRVDSETRMMGIGGLYDSTPSYEGPVSQAARLGMDVHGAIDQLLRQAKLQRQSFANLEQAFRDSIEYREHLPSIWPVSPSQVYISSNFGYRLDPLTGRRRMHKGVDLAGRRGTPVMATADGVVRRVTYGRYIGQVVQIDHLYGYMTIYGHLRRENVRVEAGQQVTRGQVIAELGNTGRSTGPHLHYSVVHNGSVIDPLDYFYVPQVATRP